MTHMQGIKTDSKRKSVALNNAELTRLKRKADKYTSVTEAAENIGIHRNVLDRVLAIGKGSPQTIEKVRQYLAA